MPLLTLYIPTYNRARFLDILLGDLAANARTLDFDFEVVISDNASTDETPDVVAKWASELPIRSLRQTQNIGMVANYFFGHGAAWGDYYLYLADDDFLRFPGLAAAMTELRENPEMGALFAPLEVFDRVAGRVTGLFNTHPRGTTIRRGNFARLARVVLMNLNVPEVPIWRTDVLRRVHLRGSDDAWWAFTTVVGAVATADVRFAREPFYRYVEQYFEGESREQGHEREVEQNSEGYRGGMEYLYARARPQLGRFWAWRLRRQVEISATRLQLNALRQKLILQRSALDLHYFAGRLAARRVSFRAPGRIARLCEGSLRIACLVPRHRYFQTAVGARETLDLVALNARAAVEYLRSKLEPGDCLYVVGSLRPELNAALGSAELVVQPTSTLDHPGASVLVAGEIADHMIDWRALAEINCRVIAENDLARQFA